jgi:hypothetical protein
MNQPTSANWKPTFSWTEEAITRLRELWANGEYTAADIARELDNRHWLTRNAIIGKAARLGLGPKAVTGRRHGQTGRHIPRPRPPRDNARPDNQHVGNKKLQAARKSQEYKDAPVDFAYLMAKGNSHCAEPGCTHTAVRGSYCATHGKRYYIKPKKNGTDKLFWW